MNADVIVDSHRHFLPPLRALQRTLGWATSQVGDHVLLERGDGDVLQFPRAICSSLTAHTASGIACPGVLSIPPRVFGRVLGTKRDQICDRLNALMAEVSSASPSIALGVLPLTTPLAVERALSRLSSFGLPGCVVAAEEVGEALTDGTVSKALSLLLDAGIAVFVHPAGGFTGDRVRSSAMARVSYPFLTGLAYVSIREAMMTTTVRSRMCLSHLPAGAMSSNRGGNASAAKIYVTVADWAQIGVFLCMDREVPLQTLYGSDFPFREPVDPSREIVGQERALAVANSNDAAHAFQFDLSGTR